MKFDSLVFVGTWSDELLSACFSKEKYTKEQVIEAFPKLWDKSVLEECPKYVLELTETEAVPFSEQKVFRLPTINDIKESVVYYNPAKRNYYSDPEKPHKNAFKTWAIYFDVIRL
ncbi:MAG: hypothetical protein ACQ5SW_12375 [Sphaerochaetaceae bacterium]